MVSNMELYDKAVKVIESCITSKQLLVAREYFHLCKFKGDKIKCEFTADLLDRWFKKDKELSVKINEDRDHLL